MFAADKLLSDGRERRAQTLSLYQARFAEGGRTPGAAAALRDLRLFTAGRRRASAVRQGGARGHPLVGPARGFPHRSAWSGQSTAGEECRHRAGGSEGWFLSQAAARQRNTRG